MILWGILALQFAALPIVARCASIEVPESLQEVCFAARIVLLDLHGEDGQLSILPSTGLAFTAVAGLVAVLLAILSAPACALAVELMEEGRDAACVMIRRYLAHDLNGRRRGVA